MKTRILQLSGILTALIISAAVILSPIPEHQALALPEVQQMPVNIYYPDPFSTRKALIDVMIRIYNNPQAPDGLFGKYFLQARKFVYVHNAKSSCWQMPEETETKRSGDCKDKALWLYDCLKKAGYSNVDYVIGKYRRADNVFHAWLVYRDGSGKQFLFDPTIQHQIWQTNKFNDGFYIPYYLFNERYPCGLQI